MGFAERTKINENVELYGSRMADLIWFIRCLNEAITILAN